MDLLKESFQRVRQDIEYLAQEIEVIKQLLSDLKIQQTNKQETSTNQHFFPTSQSQEEALKPLILPFSTRNEGVPTNQPTNKQTNQHPPISTPTLERSSFKQIDRTFSNIQKVSEVLSSLDDLKKEVRLKFKRLTEQEMIVFSTIYQLEEQGFVVDYALLSQKLNLTEISIRDYIHKILKKEIPLLKSKESNKKITLSIPLDLKRITSLQTITQLRNL